MMNVDDSCVCACFPVFFFSFLIRMFLPHPQVSLCNAQFVARSHSSSHSHAFFTCNLTSMTGQMFHRAHTRHSPRRKGGLCTLVGAAI